MNFLETKVRPILEDTISKLKGDSTNGNQLQHYDGGVSSGVDMITPAKQISLALEEWVVNTDPESDEKQLEAEIRSFLKSISVNRQIIFVMGFSMLAMMERSMDRHALLSALDTVTRELS